MLIQTTTSDQLRSIVKKFKEENRRRNVVGQQCDFAGLCSRRAATFSHGPATLTSATDHGTRIRWILSLKATVQAFWCFSGLISSTFTLVFGSGSVQGTTLLAPSLPDILGVLLRIHRYTKNIWEYIMVATIYCSQYHIPHDLIVQFRSYYFRYPKFDILVTDHRPTYSLWYDASTKQQAFTACTYLPIKMARRGLPANRSQNPPQPEFKPD